VFVAIAEMPQDGLNQIFLYINNGQNLIIVNLSDPTMYTNKYVFGSVCIAARVLISKLGTKKVKVLKSRSVIRIDIKAGLELNNDRPMQSGTTLDGRKSAVPRRPG
jgi:hypothetical protein